LNNNNVWYVYEPLPAVHLGTPGVEFHHAFQLLRETMMSAVLPVAPILIHPIWLRITHWLNALAVIVMTLSGWRIYNASPFFDFTFPKDITLGGWLGGALQWHFAAMWLLVFNGLVYLTFNILTGRLRMKLLPVRIAELFADFKAALTGHLTHADASKYNAVQKLAYLFVIVDSIVIILSGLVIWKSVQFGFLRDLLGGYEMARHIHFFAMAGLVLFFIVHVVMVMLVPKTFIAMIRGR
jgi:thiosulfate reductase cytochrome b subunit